MEKIQLTFLGTGSAIPTKTHNHSAMLLQYKDENILVDCGEGTQRQFRIAGLNPCKLTRILITHWHGDHILGLPGLFQTLALNNYNKKLKIYIPSGTRHFLDQIFRMFVFVGNLDYEVHEVDSGKIADEKDFYLEAERMSHGAKALAYAFIEKQKIRLDKKKLNKLKLPNSPLLGELQRGKDIEFKGKKIRAKDVTYTSESRKVCFIMDTKLNENMQKIAKNSDLLISESSYPTEEEKLAEEYNHLTSAQAAKTAKQAKAKKLILTHISQRYESNPKIILAEAKKIFPATQIAQDFMKFEI